MKYEATEPKFFIFFFQSEMDSSYAAFVFFYLFWVVGMLLVYFLLFDAATTAVTVHPFQSKR